jgi:membrane-associated phospholipid phosphatase
MLNSILAAVVFFVWPTTGVAQDPMSGGTVGLLWSVLQAVDRPANLFPSLHVANTCTCALALWRERGGWRLVAPVWAVAIALSTLTTKQHLLIDLFGGLALAGFSDWLAVNRVWEFAASMSARRSCPAKSPDGSAPFMRLPSSAIPKSATNT